MRIRLCRLGDHETPASSLELRSARPPRPGPGAWAKSALECATGAPIGCRLSVTRVFIGWQRISPCYLYLVQMEIKLNTYFPRVETSLNSIPIHSTQDFVSKAGPFRFRVLSNFGYLESNIDGPYPGSSERAQTNERRRKTRTPSQNQSHAHGHIGRCGPQAIPFSAM